MKRPETYAALREAIAMGYTRLSPVLRRIATYALDHPNDMALETIAVLAGRAGVQPSSLVRLAQTFGYDGFSDMQWVFRARLREQTPSYADRIRGLRTRHRKNGRSNPDAIIEEFSDAAIAGLQHLRENMDTSALERAVDLLAKAEVIHLLGLRRSFPVVAYLNYGLSHLGLRSCLLDSVGGMLREQLQAVGKKDLLVVVSFRSYAPEVVEAVETLAPVVPVIALTDSALSPIARLATVTLEIHEAEFEGFRSLSVQMCLALCLLVSLGERLVRSGGRARGIVAKPRRPALRPTGVGGVA
ncbi:MAG: MurR/RpiR family transcriptional regulator [Alphaproteobacteria bacterium]